MAIRQKTKLTIKLKGRGTSHSRSEIDADGLTAIIDEPVGRGGTNEGPSPTMTAYASLIGCTNVIAHKCAEKLGADIGELVFSMEVDFDRRGVLLIEEVDIPFTAIRLDVNVSGPASQAEIRKVAAETEKFCPISKLFKAAGTDVAVVWRKSDIG